MFGAGLVHAGVYGGHPELLELTALAGRAPDLITAAELGDAAAVRQALARDPALARAFPGPGTALRAAAYWGQPGVARLLLEAGRAPWSACPPAMTSSRSPRSAARWRPRRASRSPATARTWSSPSWRCCSGTAPRSTPGAGTGHPAASGPHAGQTAADTALSQGHLVLAAELDSR
jgi:hypothetical protein